MVAAGTAAHGGRLASASGGHDVTAEFAAGYVDFLLDGQVRGLPIPSPPSYPPSPASSLKVPCFQRFARGLFRQVLRFQDFRI